MIVAIRNLGHIISRQNNIVMYTALLLAVYANSTPRSSPFRFVRPRCFSLAAVALFRQSCWSFRHSLPAVHGYWRCCSFSIGPIVSLLLFGSWYKEQGTNSRGKRKRVEAEMRLSPSVFCPVCCIALYCPRSASSSDRSSGDSNALFFLLFCKEMFAFINKNRKEGRKEGRKTKKDKPFASAAAVRTRRSLNNIAVEDVGRRWSPNRAGSS